MKIIPAILPKSQDELVEKVQAVLGLAPSVQVDVCDGVFVPSKTEFSELPFSGEISYELDLMIQSPEDSFSNWVHMGPHKIIIHIESVRNQEKLLQVMKSFSGEIGISLSNDTPSEVFDFWIPAPAEIPNLFIQLMGIAKIGFQGESFDERVLEKINYVRAKFPDREIAVDGGVSLETIQKLRDAGVTRFVAGSAVFSGDVKENIEKLESLLQ